jgi:hypothetical protein
MLNREGSHTIALDAHPLTQWDLSLSFGMRGMQ